ncbi:MAG TPA: DUF6036 family nucleotidyltransferase [Myxococcales bacterium]|nr:DUF6036 family nucleotidyltransferase [Myxococcales bacterium]
MRSYTPGDLRVFLRAVDAHLARTAELKVMGGGAIALAYGVLLSTSDIDTFETDLDAVADAIQKAQASTGLPIQVSPLGGSVGDWPENSGERLIRVMPELPRLSIFALEQHDLALSKSVRGYENDLAAIEQLHGRLALDRDVLVRRYVHEMAHAIGDPVRLDRNFILMIDRLFGETAAEEVEVLLASRR